MLEWPSMAFSIKNIFGDPHKKGLKKHLPLMDEVSAFEPAISALSDQGIREKTLTFKARLAAVANSQSNTANTESVREAQEKILDEILPEAFALVREASRRTLGQRHFDVQIVGGAILHNHSIAEMRTGEGKTLVATLPAYLNALSGRGVHVVTVNDYLSRRDAVWMGQIYDFLGLSVGVVNHEASYRYDPLHTDVKAEIAHDQALDKERDQLGSFKVIHEFLRPVSRKEAYDADITYGTNNEFGFDYLRDNLEYDASKMRQREFNYAIVDEVDSILIDEARTPLIISAPTTDSENLYKVFADMVAGFVLDEDYTMDEKHKSIALLPAGIEKAEKSLGVGNIYTDKGIKYVHHLETAVKARAHFHLNKEYVVKDGSIVIVDEFTGRLQPGRRWSEGLHQAIEAKEGLVVQKESRTFASITFQNYFRLYHKLAGMTGTAVTSSEEFYKVYGIDTVVVPTNRPLARIDRNDLIFQTEKGKFKAVARKVKELHGKGQPVLVGTVSIEKNEVLSKFLAAEGIPHEVLNAKNHEREGEIIAQAGKKGGVTIATNMAGRGVDIKLGGNPSTAATSEEIKSIGGLFVLGTERHEARRIDNQLRGRSGRQGDPGETQFFVSLEDPLMRVFAGDTIKSLMGRLGVADDEPIENRLITKSLENAQTKIEGFNFDSRKHILEYDDVLNHQRKTVYARRRDILTGTQEDVAAKLAEIVAITPETVASDGTVTSADDNRARVEKIISSKIAEFGRERFYTVVRQTLLQTIDLFWVDHLEVMDYMRSSVNLRAYGQRDPLVEYKKEGLRLFKQMQMAINMRVLDLLPFAAGAVAAPEQVKLKEIHEGAQLAQQGGQASAADVAASGNRAARRAAKKSNK